MHFLQKRKLYRIYLLDIFFPEYNNFMKLQKKLITKYTTFWAISPVKSQNICIYI